MLIAVPVVITVLFIGFDWPASVKAAPVESQVDHADLKWETVFPHDWKNKYDFLLNDLSHLPNWRTFLEIKNLNPDSAFLYKLAKDYIGENLRKSNGNLLRCLSCQLAVVVLQELVNSGVSFDTIGSVVIELCRLFKIEKADVCEGIVNAFKEEVLFVLSRMSRSAESVQYVCGVVIGDFCFGAHSPRLEWNVTFPDIPKPPVVPPTPPKPGLPKLKVLHLTDIHLDLLYKNGSNADCGKPLCCQDGDPKGDPAGYWGDYRTCDIPLKTVENLFQNLSQATQFDYILWTGDLPSHMDWNQTRTSQLSLLENLTTLFLKYFPKTPVYSAVGNHESVPVNSFPPPFIKGNQSISWLYNDLAKSWTHWLPNDTAVTISRGGFYTTLVKPGFRIVSLNDNYCNSGNWWLFLNSTDPADELSWLVSVLQSAESHEEKVHIIGHIPPGAPECRKTWSWNYYRIVNRYESTIAGQFFGHKHYDLWEIFYDNNFKRPVSVAYVAPSLTTFVHLNPGYRVYEIDGFYPNSSWMVLDHETFIMNLTESNLKNRPIWIKEYSAKLAYNMTSLSPKDWNDVTDTLMRNRTAFEQYHRFYYKSNSANFPPCDKKCWKMMVCELRTGISHDLRPCQDLLGNEDTENLSEAYARWIEEKRVC